MAVDAGAGAVFPHGSHVPGPVEVNNRHSICYGLGNFLLSDVQECLYEALYAPVRGQLSGTATVTDADVNELCDSRDFADRCHSETVLTELTYQDSDATLRLLPVDLRYGVMTRYRGAWL